jgi:hypothetical protein
MGLRVVCAIFVCSLLVIMAIVMDNAETMNADDIGEPIDLDR